jgi:hypothetical protein
MSKGIPSGVPPADGGDGGEAGAGACANACELIATAAHAANTKEIIERMIFSLLKFCF